MESTSLIDKVTQELEILDSIYNEEGVISETAIVNNKGAVQCMFKLQPNTGFNAEKISLIIYARFIFSEKVRSQDHVMIFIVPLRSTNV